jgi:hypothetical protein
MSVQERVTNLDVRLAHLADPQIRAGTAAMLADCEAKVAASLALYLEGEIAAVFALLGSPTTDHGATVLVSTLAALSAATEALTATIGDDADRGRLAVMVLRERSAEYNQAADILLRRAEQDANTG